MGWNQGYSIFEATVVGAYDLGKLDKDLLSVLMEPYRGSDIDSGGEMGLRSHDGLDVVDVVLKTWGIPIPERPPAPANWKDRTKAQDKASEDYHEQRDEAFRTVTKHFDWR